MLLERYLSGDVASETRTRIERALREDTSVRERLELLQRERSTFYAVDPPPVFAHRVATRIVVAHEQRAAAAPKKSPLAFLFSPAFAAAFVVVVVAGVLVLNRDRVTAPGQELAAEPPEAAPVVTAPTPSPSVPAAQPAAVEAPAMADKKQVLKVLPKPKLDGFNHPFAGDDLFR
jgi:hypothetical protein